MCFSCEEMNWCLYISLSLVYSFVSDGILVQDEDGRPLGKSKEAGFTAVAQVAVSRVATALPALTIPPLVMAPLERTRLFMRYPIFSYFGNLGKIQMNALLAYNFLALITLSLMTALPAAIALFPQMGTMPVGKLEPVFQSLKRKNGQPVQQVTFNKGL